MPLVNPATAAAAAAPSREPEQLQLFEGGIDLAALRIERAALAERRRSSNTLRAYAADWRDFAAWCAAAGRACLPAAGDTVSLYCVSQARAGLAVATVHRRVAAIASRHLGAGYPSPAAADVREVLFGISRKFGAATRPRAALLVPELVRVLAAAGDGARGARDRAIMLLGFASACRRSELAALELVDVSFESAGVRLEIRKSKTDQMSLGRVLGVHRGGSAGTCPVLALEAWIVGRGRWPGPLFCDVHPTSGAVRARRIGGAAVNRVLKELASRAGLDPARLGAHSLRAGCCTAAAASGAGELAIRERTGHKSLAMLGRYVRHGNVFAVDPLAGVL